SLRQELRDVPGVHVCTVFPATMDTPIFDILANYTRWRPEGGGPGLRPGSDRAARRATGAAAAARGDCGRIRGAVQSRQTRRPAPAWLGARRPGRRPRA